MSYEVVLADDVELFLQSLHPKSERICRQNLAKLSNPFPGKGLGDKEKLITESENIYRLHIARSYTAFYVIGEKQVRVFQLTTIEAAHKLYKV